jgi:fimbrial chaperone protein
MARLMLAAFIAGAVLLTGSSALADGIGILPTTIHIDAAHRIATVTIVNNDPTLHTFQITPFTWQQINGQDKLTQTTDLLVSPPVFTVIANGQQAVRFALRQAAPVADELTFRILLRTAPTDTVPLGSMAQMRVGFSLPVFIASPQGGSAKVTCSYRDLGHNHIALIVENSGLAHIHMLHVRVADDRGTLYDGGTAQYVLAAAKATMNLAASRSAAGDKISVRLSVDQGDPIEVVAHRAG